MKILKFLWAHKELIIGMLIGGILVASGMYLLGGAVLGTSGATWLAKKMKEREEAEHDIRQKARRKDKEIDREKEAAVRTVKQQEKEERQELSKDPEKLVQEVKEELSRTDEQD